MDETQVLPDQHLKLSWRVARAFTLVLSLDLEGAARPRGDRSRTRSVLGKRCAAAALSNFLKLKVLGHFAAILRLLFGLSIRISANFQTPPNVLPSIIL
jgi:hypothetical protein